MSAAKHTPGPWRVVIDGTCSAAWPFVLSPQHMDADDGCVAELPTAYLRKSHAGRAVTFQEAPGRFKPSGGHDEVVANARLIAAAPDLLEALQLAYRHLNGGGDSLTPMEFAEAHRKARAAIAKATGGAA